jgi:hypothetical protein
MMIESINYHSIANEVRLRSQSRKDVFLICETSRYDESIRGLFAKIKRNIIIAYKPQNVIGALKVLQDDGYQNVYACVEGSIDTTLHADVLPNILRAANWSNIAAKQKLEVLAAKNQPTDIKQGVENSMATSITPQLNQNPSMNGGVSTTKPSPENILVAIEEALKLGNSAEAIKLTKSGTELFPDNDHLSRVAKILAPPVIRVIQNPQTQPFASSRKWLREHAQQYKGQWVAVSEGILLGSAITMQALLTYLGPDLDRDNTLITKVL